MSELAYKIERGRAEKAYEFVEEASKEKIGRDYKSLVKKLPQMIMSGGLGQTIAFLYSKITRSSNPSPREESANSLGDSTQPSMSSYFLLYDQLTRYFRSNIPLVRLSNSGPELVKWVISLDSYNYYIATQEVLSLVKWLKRFAEGMIRERG